MAYTYKHAHAIRLKDDIPLSNAMPLPAHFSLTYDLLATVVFEWFGLSAVLCDQCRGHIYVVMLSLLVSS